MTRRFNKILQKKCLTHNEVNRAFDDVAAICIQWSVMRDALCDIARATAMHTVPSQNLHDYIRKVAELAVSHE